MLAAGLTVAGCAPTDPTIHVPASARPTPELNALTQACLEAEQALVAGFESIIESPPASMPAGGAAWAKAQLAARGAHIERLRLPDPMRDSNSYLYPEPASSGSVAAFADWEQATSTLKQAAATAQAAHEAAANSQLDVDQELALLYAGLATSAQDVTNGPAALSTSAVPRSFSPATHEAATNSLLNWYWSLGYSLEVGLGQLDQDSKLFKAGQARLAEAVAAADALAATVTNPPARQASYETPTATNAKQVRAAWAAQELAILGAAGLALATSPDAETAANYQRVMYDESAHIRDWDGALPIWPGFS